MTDARSEAQSRTGYPYPATLAFACATVWAIAMVLFADMLDLTPWLAEQTGINGGFVLGGIVGFGITSIVVTVFIWNADIDLEDEHAT